MKFKLTFILIFLAIFLYIIKDYLEIPIYNTDPSNVPFEPLSFKYIKNGKVDQSSLFKKKNYGS